MFFKTPLAQSANRNFRFDFPLTSTVLLTSSAYNAPSTFSAPAASSGRRDAARAIVVILALLIISRLRGWIDTGEFLSLVIEVLVVVMIGMDLRRVLTKQRYSAVWRSAPEQRQPL
jgi:hypothetical protein